jgi:D-amino-acid oxidase
LGWGDEEDVMARAVAPTLPSPDFTFVPGVTPLSAGLRPYRKVTYRLEGQIIRRKLVVHNYGHGGAGITMSWGCAREVVNLVKAREPNPQGKPVAILGAGVMGLTAATLLAELRMDVTVFAKKFIPETTSNIAGGQWAPSKVEFRPNEKVRFQTILRNAFKDHLQRGEAFGVSRRTNYSLREIEHFKLVPTDVVPAPTRVNLPFEHLTRRGFAYKTLLVEPPIFLSKLHRVLEAGGTRFVQKEFFSESDVLALPANIIVNCTGLGSDAIWQDKNLIPIKGQLVLLPAQTKLEYLYSGDGYVFPRKDYTVVGGTEEYGYTDCAPDPQRCAAVVKHVKDVFEGTIARTAPSWLIRNE